MSNLTPELQKQIEQEAKNFTFYNYVSAAHNGTAVFDDIESWPDNAQAAYYALVNYTSGRNVCWPYIEPTLPMKWQEAEQRAARYEKALALIEQMSDPGDYWKAICDMKAIASEALKPKPTTD